MHLRGMVLLPMRSRNMHELQRDVDYETCFDLS